MEEMKTLDLDKTAITELPSSICNLIGLEILHMEECPNLMQLPASICTLPNLWKLTANFCEGMSHFKMCEGGEICVKHKFKCYQDLQISEDGGYIWSGGRSYDNLIDLCLTDCNRCRRIPALRHLPSLRSLRIERLQSVVTVGSEFFKAANDCASLIVPFPSLETLHFEDMISWQQWHSIDMQAFPKLRFLNFVDCPKLVGNLPPQLLSLEGLRIMSCPLLASSIPKCPNIHELEIIKSENVVLQEQELPPSLRRLAISSAHMLGPLSEKSHIEDLTVDCSDAVPSPVIHIPPSVKQLDVRNCGNLKACLVSKAPLLHLRKISIYKCKFLPSLFDDMERLVPNLKELSIEGCPEMEPFLARSLPSSLKRLEIRGCDKLLSCHTLWRRLPTITELLVSTLSDTLHCTGLQHLNSLQLLEIVDSFSLEKLEGGMLPPSLHWLHIRDCGLLEGPCRNKDEKIWPKISHVPYISLNEKYLRNGDSDSDSVNSSEDEDICVKHKFKCYQDLQISEDGGYIWSGGRSYDNLIYLCLTDCNRCRRIPALRHLPSLRSLRIERLQSVVTVGSEFFKAANDCASLIVPFPSLETLHFEDMISWQQWHSIDMQAFPKLRFLNFVDCPKLVGNLPPQLLSLEGLRIMSCPLLASSIPKCPNIHELEIIKSPNVVLQEQELPPSLRRLAISSAHMLGPLSEKSHIEDLTVDCSDAVPSPVIHIPPSVKQLDVRNCGNLKACLVSKAPLLHLRKISIYKCKFLPSLFDDMERLVPNLKELSIEGCPEMEPFLARSLPSSLKRLEIRGCDKLLSCHTLWRRLPTITELLVSTLSDTLHCTGLQHLNSLQLLEIVYSCSLEELEGGMLPPSLHWLHIRDCGLLEGPCRNKDEKIWPKISHVPYISLNEKYLRNGDSDSDSVNSSEDEEICIEHQFESYEDLEILEDGGYRGTTYAVWSSGGLSYDNLIMLRLTDCNKCWRIPALGRLPSLRSLRIERLRSVVIVGSEFFKAANDCASLKVPFPSLETLHFEDMISWQQWHSIDMHAFSKLRFLSFVDCPKLVGHLPPQLLSLEGLRIMSCPMLSSSIPKCPNIHELAINKSPNVVLQEQELPPSLRGPAISGGRMLGSLFVELHIEDLIVLDWSDAVPPPMIHIPPSVKRLLIGDCENLKACLGFNTTSLQQLELRYSDKLEKIEGGMMPPSLLMLHIRDCSLLEERCVAKDKEIWPKISHVSYISLNGWRFWDWFEYIFGDQDMNDATILEDHQDNDATILEDQTILEDHQDNDATIQSSAS
ncbi:uncharacterized protein LOC114719350 [Neltuma alba]|uniref:uncharacterized protein LOC114719350 n=1 Tax=Neltuma alba TaxID=207710 RepID=UPI0010A4210F|nr:uncharacterized protein LOC114719350 [Prosopis alba]